MKLKKLFLRRVNGEEKIKSMILFITFSFQLKNVGRTKILVFIIYK